MTIQDLPAKLVQHLFFTLVPVAIGFLLGVLIGILLSRKPKLSGIVLPILSVFNTIPGIVFIGLLFLAGHPRGHRAGRPGDLRHLPGAEKHLRRPGVRGPAVSGGRPGLRHEPVQSLLRVELPLALPTIIGGLRMSTVYTVSWAVLASMIGLGGLGDFIYAGLSSNDNALILLGAIPRPAGLRPGHPGGSAPAPDGAQGAAEGEVRAT